MAIEQLQEWCEAGQRELMRCNYLQAERALQEAEREAWGLRDFDTLARLYMPLQEARRQRRQRCGEGVVCLDLVAENEDDLLDGRHVVENYPTGQLLVAGWGSIEPAIQVRRLAAELELYVETFLGAVYPTEAGKVIAIVPLETSSLPRANGQSLKALEGMLPANSLLLRAEDIAPGQRRGTAETFSEVMGMWERLHAPFVITADAESDAVRRIEAFRRVIQVDYACEIAHQEIAATAHKLAHGLTQSQSEGSSVSDLRL